MRLFIGIALGRMAVLQLVRSLEELKKIAKGNFADPANLHVTLQFLGEKSLADVHNISKAMHEAAAGFNSIRISLLEPGKFDRGQESIVWYGLKGETDKLKQLYERLSKSLVSNGISFEKGTFKPHITLSRRTQTNLDWQEAYARITVGQEEFTVDEVILF